MDHLINEVNINYLLNHRNIVKLYTHIEDDKNVYLIMQVAEKGPLSQDLKPGKFTENEVKNYAL